MKKLLISLFLGLFVVSCATVPLDYSKPETHTQILDNSDREYPQMALLPETYEWLIKVEKETGSKMVGSFVDNHGDFLIFFEDPQGNCEAMIVLVTRGGRAFPVESCEDAWELYETVCIKQNLCTDNPHLNGNI